MRAMKNASTAALVGIWMILLTAFVVTILYVGRQLLIPLALAAMLTFLLAPLVGYIERWIGRIAAVLIVVAMLFSVVGGSRLVVNASTDRPRGEASRLPDEHRQQIERDPTSHRRCVWSLFAQRFRAAKANAGFVGAAGECDRSGAGNKSHHGRALSQRACGSTADAGSDRRIAKPSSANPAKRRDRIARTARDGRPRFCPRHLHAVEARGPARPNDPLDRARPDQRDHAGDGRRREPRRPLPYDAASGEREFWLVHCDRTLLHRRAERCALGRVRGDHAIRAVRRSVDRGRGSCADFVCSFHELAQSASDARSFRRARID